MFWVFMPAEGLLIFCQTLKSLVRHIHPPTAQASHSEDFKSNGMRLQKKFKKMFA